MRTHFIVVSSRILIFILAFTSMIARGEINNPSEPNNTTSSSMINNTAGITSNTTTPQPNITNDIVALIQQYPDLMRYSEVNFVPASYCSPSPAQIKSNKKNKLFCQLYHYRNHLICVCGKKV